MLRTWQQKHGHTRKKNRWKRFMVTVKIKGITFNLSKGTTMLHLGVMPY